MAHPATGVVLSLALAAAAASAPGEATADPSVARGIRLVEEGDYDAAILTLDAAARRLAEQPAQVGQLAQAYLYLGIAYLGKGQEAAARARFRDAVLKNRELRLSPEEFPPKVIDAFEAAREDAASTPEAAETTKKKGGGKGLLIGLGVAGAGGAVAVAAGGGGDEPAAATTDTRRRQEFSGSVPQGEQRSFEIVATAAGTLEATLTWQDGQISLNLSCQESNPPFTDCGGTFNRTTNTSAVFRASVTQKPYLLSVGNFSAKEAPEPFTMVVLHP